MKTLKIYKIGGGILDDSHLLSQFLMDFSLINSNKILVHGGGKGANQLLKKLNIIPQVIEGRRVTNLETLEVLISFYAGTTNKKVVVELQKFGCNALGLSGCDANSICGIQRPIKKIDFGYVGDLYFGCIEKKVLRLLLMNGIVPVFCPIIHDGQGNLLNTNADTIAGTLAQQLVDDFEEVELHFCFDKIGVLRNINDENSLIPIINKENFQSLISQNIIHSGMIPKLENAFLVIEKGVKKVFLQHAKNIKNNIHTRIE